MLWIFSLFLSPIWKDPSGDNNNRFLCCSVQHIRGFVWNSTCAHECDIIIVYFIHLPILKSSVNWGWMYQIICTQQRSPPLALVPVRSVRIKLTTLCLQTGTRPLLLQPKAKAGAAWGIDCVIFPLPDEQRSRERRREGRDEEKEKIRSFEKLQG